MTRNAQRTDLDKLAMFLLVFAMTTISMSNAFTYYNIGGIFQTQTSQDAFTSAVDYVNAYPSSYGLGPVRINSSVALINSDPIVCMKEVCNKLINNSVYVVVTDRFVNNTRPPYIVSYACAFYSIPVVGVASREDKFSDKSIHSLFLRTVPSYGDQARAMVQLVKKFNWGKVILITSNEYDYRKLFVKFTSLAYDHSVTIEHPIIFASGTTNLTKHLQHVSSKQSKVIIFGGRGEDAINLYKAANSYGLTGKGYIWIVSQGAADGIAKQYAPQGLLTMKPKQELNVKAHIQDAVRVIATTLGRQNQNGVSLAAPPSSCDEAPGKWNSGKVLFDAMVNRTHPGGVTGDIEINVAGDRINAAYDVYNMKEMQSGQKYLKKVGHFDQDEKMVVNDSYIVWPGNETQVPRGVFISTHLKIVTAEAHPFVTAHEMPASKNCSDLKIVQRGIHRKLVKCRGPSSSRKGHEHCCAGFCIDLLIKLANRMNFTYDLHYSADRQFGSLVKVNGSEVKRWNGAVGELIDGKADLIVAPLTINNERAQYIEFSKPYKYQGITILVKKNPSQSTLVSFLRPFKTELWLLVLLSVHIVAVILYILDRLSPFGRFKRARANQDEKPLDLPSAMWFSWGVLLNSGIGEVTPRSFSARVLGMVWAAFAMIIVASYTANLAAFLVLDRPKPVVSGIDDPNLRNPSNSFPFATVTGSSVEAYFKRQVELSNMYTFMEKYNVKTDVEGIQKVKTGKLKAFIWDSPILLYETSANCDLTTVGEIFGRSGYGIGMPKGSPWSNNISLSILHFHESGIMEQLEAAWIDFGNCPKENSAPTTLGLSHMLGVFIMVGVGIGAGIIIVILEVVYYRRKGMRKEQKDLVARCAEQWKHTTAEGKKKNKSKESVVFTGMNGFELNRFNDHRNNMGFEPDIITTTR